MMYGEEDVKRRVARPLGGLARGLTRRGAQGRSGVLPLTIAP